MRVEVLNLFKNAWEKIIQLKNKIKNCFKWARLHPIKFSIIATVLIVFFGCIFNQDFKINVIKFIMYALSVFSYPLKGLYSLSKPKTFTSTEVKSFVEILKSLGLIIGGILGFWLAFERFKIADKNHKLEKESHSLELKKEVNQRFAKAVELLGNENESVRIGALYTLEQILKEETSYYENCMDIIAGYVRCESASDRMQNEEFKQWQEKFKLWKEEKNKENPTYSNYNDIPKPSIRKLPEDIITAVNILSSNSKEVKKIDLKALDWSWVDLRLVSIEFKNIDFSHSMFISIDLGFKKFLNCNLKVADLTRANLTKADFAEAILNFAKLTGADLTMANLTRANLNFVNLTLANLTYANLVRADLTKANLTEANLTKANLTKANLTKADLTNADLMGATLKGVKLIRAKLTGADLSYAELTNADFAGANFTGAKNIKTADFDNAKNAETIILDNEELKNWIIKQAKEETE